MIGTIAALASLAASGASAYKSHSGNNQSSSSISNPGGSPITAPSQQPLGTNLNATLGNAAGILNSFSDIWRMADPESFARRQGEADFAYQDSMFPGTNTWERLGSSGIQGSLETASMSGSASSRSAGIATSPAHREQERKDKAFSRNMEKLDADTQRTINEYRKLAEETKSEIWRAKYAAVREMVESWPGNPTRGLVYSMRGWIDATALAIERLRPLESIEQIYDQLKKYHESIVEQNKRQRAVPAR